MKRNSWIILVAATLVVILVWFVAFSRPKSSAISDTNAELDDARSDQQSLEATLARLQELDRRRPEIQAAVQRLNEAIPADPDLADFIFLANDAAAESGVDWISIAPSPPAVDPGGGPSVIALSIQIQGGFYQVVDYLNRLEELDRLVVVDSVSITAGTDSEDAGGAETTATTLATSTSNSATTLSVSLTGSMFTRAAPSTPGAPGAAPDASGGSPPADSSAPAEETS